MEEACQQGPLKGGEKPADMLLKIKWHRTLERFIRSNMITIQKTASCRLLPA